MCPTHRADNALDITRREDVTTIDQILTPEGRLLREAPLEVASVVALYEKMLFARQYDRKSISLQMQGRLATYSPFEGQEAAQLGAVASLDPQDWLVATYRDAAAMWGHGYPMELLFLGRTGDERGGSPPDGVPVLPPSITVGGHMIHAVGLAWAARLQSEEKVALTLFGDGATSEGDFHEAMNFAAVYDTPTIFLCQNNGYAISLPTHEQTRSASIAIKAEAYGMPGFRVDGNDLLGVYETTRDAVARARRGDGPTLIEALTYRIGPHTTNDDPSRYRSAEEEAEARRRDPLVRVRAYLEDLDAWDAAREQRTTTAAAEYVDEAIAKAEAVPEPDTAHVFGAMFATKTPQLTEQEGQAGL